MATDRPEPRPDLRPALRALLASRPDAGDKKDKKDKKDDAMPTFLRLFGPASFSALLLVVMTLFNQANSNAGDVRREAKLATERGAEAIQPSDLEERSARLNKDLEEVEKAEKRVREEWQRQTRGLKEQALALERESAAVAELSRSLGEVRERLTVLESRPEGKGGKPN
jgi:hypothetical protein